MQPIKGSQSSPARPPSLFAYDYSNFNSLFSSQSTSPGSPQSGSNSYSYLPALYNARTSDGTSRQLVAIDINDPGSIRTYLTYHLSVARLNKIHKHLWLAGLPNHAQPLHTHLQRGRKLVVTDSADLHLLWRDDILLIMPLPLYLLDHACWSTHFCTEQALYELANGFLLTYICLICTQIDLTIAQDSGLLPKSMSWPDWTAFVRSMHGQLNPNNPRAINPRYIYSELRLNRINWIYRLCSRTTNFGTFIRGYSYRYTTYGSFFERNTAWIVSTIVYITVVLTAMQVGLGTIELKDNTGFSRACYGLTILAIVAPLGGVALVAAAFLVLVPYNLVFALKRRGKRVGGTDIKNYGFH